MTAKEFDENLRSLLEQQPFHPFVVEYTNGDRFEVDAPYVAYAEGGAGFISPGKQVFFFTHKDVRQFVPASSESRS